MFGVATQNGVGVGIGNIPSLTTLPYATQLYLAVLALFSSGANGAFLDANDWGPTGTGGTGVVYSDGATPVTAMEQPVQIILDKSKGLAKTEKITNAADRTFSSNTGFWTLDAGGVTISGGTANWAALSGYAFSKGGFLASGGVYLVTVTVPSISSGGLKIYAPTAIGTLPTYTAPGTYTAVVVAPSASSFGVISVGSTTAQVSFVSCQQIAGNHHWVSASANRPTITARYNLLTQTATLSTQSVTVAAGSHVLAFTGSGSVALSGAATGTKTAGSNTITCTAGTLTLTVTGSVTLADLRPAYQATGLIPLYQWVTTGGAGGYDVSPAFPPIIKGNAANQFLQGSLDLSGTSKATIWTGMMATSTADGMLAELSASVDTNAGSFAFPQTFSNRLYATGHGASGVPQVYAAQTVPATFVAACQIDLTAETAAATLPIQINGVAQSLTVSTVSPPGGGAFGSYASYLFARAGTSVFSSSGFNTLVLVGKATSAAEMSIGNAFANQKLRAYA